SVASANAPPPKIPQPSTMAASLDKFYATVVEPFFDFFGIGVKSSPLRRFVVVSLGTSLAAWIRKPEYLFDAEGKPRSLYFTNSEHGVALPWWAFAGLMGTLSILFL